jgi:hypothetical protein
MLPGSYVRMVEPRPHYATDFTGTVITRSPDTYLVHAVMYIKGHPALILEGIPNYFTDAKGVKRVWGYPAKWFREVASPAIAIMSPEEVSDNQKLIGQ